jgi:Fe-S cluster biosynthesis and repair protein YggX
MAIHRALSVEGIQAMARMVQCTVLKRRAEGLDRPPHPGPLGKRIYENVSQEGWQKWLERLTMIINENGLSSADPRAIELIEQHMIGFLFQEGDKGQAPEGFRPAGAKK